MTEMQDPMLFIAFGCIAQSIRMALPLPARRGRRPLAGPRDRTARGAQIGGMRRDP